MHPAVKRAKLFVYGMLKEGGGQGRANAITEKVICAVIGCNVVLIVFESMGINGRMGLLLSILRTLFFIFFLTEYLLKLWVSDIMMNDVGHPISSRIRYMLTFRAIINLLALLPVMLGGTFIDFRIFRVLRLLWITQMRSIKQYTDILSQVFRLKRAQLLSSLFILFVFMITSAVIIYDLEHPTQPEIFNNIFSCLWWAMSAVTTVGYGDMFPITPVGKTFGSFMSIFGVFLTAVPVGILTTGFFEISKRSDRRDDK